VVDDHGGEAGDLRHGLRMTFEMLVPLVDQARLEARDGYRVMISPLTPFPPFCGVLVDDPAQDDRIARELPAAAAAVEAAGAPCFVETVDDR
jgi:hypothetical protein